jgi:hypothetical protein
VIVRPTDTTERPPPAAAQVSTARCTAAESFTKSVPVAPKWGTSNQKRLVPGGNRGLRVNEGDDDRNHDKIAPRSPLCSIRERPIIRRHTSSYVDRLSSRRTCGQHRFLERRRDFSVSFKPRTRSRRPIMPGSRNKRDRYLFTHAAFIGMAPHGK